MRKAGCLSIWPSWAWGEVHPKGPLGVPLRPKCVPGVRLPPRRRWVDENAPSTGRCIKTGMQNLNNRKLCIHYLWKIKHAYVHVWMISGGIIQACCFGCLDGFAIIQTRRDMQSSKQIKDGTQQSNIRKLITHR